MVDSSDNFEIELVRDTDNVSRSCNTPPGIDPESNFVFSSEHGKVESVYWSKYAETIESVHERGCRNLASRNVRRAQSELPPAEYIGAITSPVELITRIKTGRGFGASVKHCPEGDDRAHAHICVLEPTDVGQGKFNKNDRREFISLLCNTAFGPIDVHSCVCIKSV